MESRPPMAPRHIGLPDYKKSLIAIGENDQAEIPSDSWGDAEGSGKLLAI